MRPLLQTVPLADGSYLSNDPDMLNRNDIHKWLSEQSYWCKNIPFETIAEAIDNSYCFGISHNGRQLAFARVVTDYATFAYLCDVFVIEDKRGQGLSKQMLAWWLAQDWTKKLRRLLLATHDAHSLYQPFGFEPLAEPSRFLTIVRRDIYGDTQNQCI